MKTLWNIVPAEPDHIPAIAANMRKADRREVWASHRHSPEEALANALALSELAWTCFVSFSPAFMWGVARQDAPPSGIRKGAPWLLATPDMLKVRREFLRQCPDYVNRMQERFPRLENHVHAENRLSIRWLRWCGFTVDDVPELINGEKFFLFWREADA